MLNLQYGYPVVVQVNPYYIVQYQLTSAGTMSDLQMSSPRHLAISCARRPLIPQLPLGSISAFQTKLYGGVETGDPYHA